MDRLDAQIADRLLAVLPHALVLVDASDPSFPVRYANPAYVALTGDSATLDPQAIRLLAQALATGRRATHPVQVARKDGGASWCELSVTPVADNSGAITRLLAVWTDTGPLRDCQDQLTFQANHDALTGLPNRPAFNALLHGAIGHTRRGGGALAVLYIGIDHFNRINESLGHQAGDAFLAAVAHRLARVARPGDALARHGGDTFAMLLADVGGAGQAGTMCERLMEAMEEPFKIAGQPLYGGCSIGVALFPRDGDDAATLLRFADMALSHARAAGGNRHHFFTPQMSEQAQERVELEAALRGAAERSEFELHYQPIADMQSGKVCAVEGLVRWMHPKLGLIDASRFIPVAEDAGLMGALGDWVLQRALADMAAWRGTPAGALRVALNISPRQFRDRSLVGRVRTALQDSGLAPSQLILEIRETVLMLDPGASEQTLAQLKELGVGVALDDFGSGYSSLSHLRRFPLDVVKIDGELTRHIVTDEQSAALCRSVIAMAHHLGIAVTAEGVETEQQCDFLRRHSCDQIQGYFLGAPADADGVAALMRDGHALPAHLLRIQKQKRTLLLVDDEANILSSLKRLLRRDDYTILTAGGGQEALDLMAKHEVDVIVSDQRMPGMLGADFLRAAKDLYPDTVRIMLSGYTELQSVTSAVNEGAIYKFLTKPWDDELLRGHIAEAFRLKEIADENERLNLELRTANADLAAANRKMEELLRQKQQQITRDEISLSVARELLQFMPLPVIGLDDDGMVAFVNAAADHLFAHQGGILGEDAALVLPELFKAGRSLEDTQDVLIDGQRFRATFHHMGAQSQSRGSLITLERVIPEHLKEPV